jgi:Na+/phosphate symporter
MEISMNELHGDIVAVKELMEKCLNEIESFTEKPNKAKSLRIRKLTTEIGKQSKFLRATLIELDKEGY